MTVALPIGSRRPSAARPLPHFGPAPYVAFACLASFALSWGHAVAVWRTGTFFDTDDAMRMVQVRDWLAGQGWFDLTAHRLDPPGGLAMHWSRLIDVPLGILVRLFELVAPPQDAERLARIAFPLGCQALLILAFVRSARMLCGPQSLVPALLVITLNGFQFGQFVAGRVDHHAPQIVLLVTIVGSVAAGLRGAGRGAAVAGALGMALSLGISLENLPFVATAVAALGVAWVVKGRTMAPFIEAFGLGLAGFVALVFAATTPPAHYTAVTNDALSAPHVFLALLGGTGLAGLTRLRVTGATATQRGVGLLIVGAAAVGAVLLLCPGFPASPYGAVDPVVRAVWLSHVTEATPLPAAIALHPAAATLILAPLLCGLAACLCAACASRAGARAAWALLAAMIAVGLAGACWEVRVASSAMPLAALGGVWAGVQVRRRIASHGAWWPAVTTGLAVLPFAPLAWALVPAPDEAPEVSRATQAAQTCREAGALAPLARLAPGLVFAPVDAGSHLLAHTRLSVLAAPYHRNNAGNRIVIDGFSASPAEAETLVAATGAAYVALCPGEVQAHVLAERAPDGLAAQLLAGATPAWLTRVPLPETPFQVYAVNARKIAASGPAD